MDPRLARRGAAIALVAGIVADGLFDRTSLGINVPLATAALLVLVTWFGANRRPADALDLWLPAVALAASLGPAIRTDPIVVALDIWLVIAASAGWSLAVNGVAVTRRTATAVAALGARAAVALAFGLVWLLRRSGADGYFTQRGRHLGTLAPFARGALVAIPVVAGFTLLLTSADAVFGRALDEALHLPFDLHDLIQRGVFTMLAAGLVGGLLAIATGVVGVLDARDGSRSETTASAASPASPWSEVPGGAGPDPAKPAPARTPRSGAVETLVVMFAVDVLFALFAAVQVVYLFGGADTVALVGMTFSDYAREGYFQLVGVVGLAGLLLLGAHEVVGRTRAFLVAAMTMLGLTGVILASAAFRLGLYQGAYGWTELRFFVAASIVWLAACVVLAVALLAGNRMRWLPHGLAMSAVAVTLAVSALGPQAFVMEQNVARVLDPSLVPPDGRTGIDLEYGLTLGDDAIPALVAALHAVPAPDESGLLYQLNLRREELEREAAEAGPLEWNLAREQARAALATLVPAQPTARGAQR